MKKTKTVKDDFLTKPNYILGLGGAVTGTGIIGSIGVVEFQSLKKAVGMGSKVDPKNIDKQSPRTRLFIMNEEGIDNLIGRLKLLRLQMKAAEKAMTKNGRVTIGKDKKITIDMSKKQLVKAKRKSK